MYEWIVEEVVGLDFGKGDREGISEISFKIE